MIGTFILVAVSFLNNRAKLKIAVASMDAAKKRAIMRATERKTSKWLTVLPAYHRFDLSPVKFCDALA